jgi:ABC-type branched-subunit amino acid transport system substrate-binding protein
MRCSKAAFLVAGAALLALVPSTLRAVDPAPSREELRRQVDRGRRIYREGMSPARTPITALMSEARIEVPAATVPCANCHGRDGRGGKEGGVSPSDLTWQSLTRPYEVTAATGRRHSAYDDRGLVKAIALGLDPGGNALHVAMPRFQMSRADMADLLAYLRHLGDEVDPGITATAIRVGLLVPKEPPLAGMGRTVQATLAARFDAVNQQGGIYGRTLELATAETTGPPEQQQSWTADFLDRQGVFAAVGAFLVGADDALAALFGERRIPLIGPFTLHPHEAFPLNRYVFYLEPGLAEQASALVSAARRLPWGSAPKAWAIVAPRDPSFDGAVAGAEKRGKEAGWPAPRVVRFSGAPDADPALPELARDGIDPLLFVGSGAEAVSLLARAEKLAWHSHVLGTATAADGLLAAPPAFAGKIVVALPSLPGAASPEALAAYRTLAAAHHLSSDDLSAQLAALAAADVLIEGLRRTGRDLSREKLLSQLEALRGFTTGYSPPLTFGPNQRLGAKGAYVFAVDLAARRLAPGGGWVEAE